MRVLTKVYMAIKFTIVAVIRYILSIICAHLPVLYLRPEKSNHTRNSLEVHYVTKRNKLQGGH
jgi:hypothetical protein